MDIFGTMADRQIQEAMRNGLFDNLPGKGKPLDLGETSGVPSELWLGYKILRNAGVLPEEMQLKKDIHTLQDLITATEDPELQADLRRSRRDKMLRLDMMLERARRGR